MDNKLKVVQLMPIGQFIYDKNVKLYKINDPAYPFGAYAIEVGKIK